MIRNFALIFLLLSAIESHAVILHSCESAESVKKRADDELCDYLVDASEDCFKKLNEFVGALEGRPATVPAKDIVAEAEPIRDTYVANIVTVKSYLNLMEVKACGDQRARIRVMIEEFNVDLKDVNSIISKAKGKK